MDKQNSLKIYESFAETMLQDGASVEGIRASSNHIEPYVEVGPSKGSVAVKFGLTIKTIRYERYYTKK